MYTKSDTRIEENNQMIKDRGEEDDDDNDNDDDMEMVKEDNKGEYDLQLCISELIGIIFKTHKELCGNSISILFTNILPQAINSSIKEK